MVFNGSVGVLSTYAQAIHASAQHEFRSDVAVGEPQSTPEYGPQLPGQGGGNGDQIGILTGEGGHEPINAWLA